MITSNSWIGIGGGGIGTNNVLFYTNQTDTDNHFSFNNPVFKGVSFWDLSRTGADLSLSNGQGCAQFVRSDRDEQRLLFGSGLLAAGAQRYRARKQ